MRITIAGNFLSNIPTTTGIYRYYDASGVLLYVGKATNLASRIQSYFREANLSPRIKLMISQAVTIEITLTANEQSALLLESNFIKKQQPKYNICLKNSTSNLYLILTEHAFPACELKQIKHQPVDNQFFGPYLNRKIPLSLLHLLQKIFRLRSCSDLMFATRSRPCMLYQINLCSAPCVAKITHSEYAQTVKHAISFLNGDYHRISIQLSADMYHAAKELKFEQAAILRNNLSNVQDFIKTQNKSSSNYLDNNDIILHKEVENWHFVYIIIIRGGLYIGDKHYELPNVVNLLEGFLEQYYNRQPIINHLQLYCNVKFSEQFHEFCTQKFSINIHVLDNDWGTSSKMNHKLKFNKNIADVMSIAYKNFSKIIDTYNINCNFQHNCWRLSTLSGCQYIDRIECYDVSHHAGCQVVAAMSVYDHGIINREYYRTFRLDNTNGNDTLGLEMTLIRRFSNTKTLPQLVIVDGGLAQLRQTIKTLTRLNLTSIVVAAIYKGKKRNEIYDTLLFADGNKIYFVNEREVFRLVQTLRDEAHRIAIGAHRKLAIKTMSFSVLDKIVGVGIVKRKALQVYFGNINAIMAADAVELSHVDGISTKIANNIVEFFARYNE